MSDGRRKYLQDDVMAEEKVHQRVMSGSDGVKKVAHFNEAKDLRMEVPSESSSEKEATKGSGSPSPRRERTDDLDKFETRACWNLDLACISFMRRKSNVSMTSRSGMSLASHESMEEIREAVQEKMLQSKDLLVIHPHATFKIVWDLFGMIFLLRDIFFIPLQLFNIPDTYVIEWLDNASLIFWSIDIILSFFTGYYEKGRLELHHKRIACNYIKTWFFLDVVVVGIDWWFQTQQNAGSAEGVARVTAVFEDVSAHPTEQDEQGVRFATRADQLRGRSHLLRHSFGDSSNVRFAAYHRMRLVWDWRFCGRDRRKELDLDSQLS